MGRFARFAYEEGPSENPYAIAKSNTGISNGACLVCRLLDLPTNHWLPEIGLYGVQGVENLPLTSYNEIAILLLLFFIHAAR